jgi:TIR domain
LSQAFLSHTGQDNDNGHNAANFTKHVAASLRRDGIQRFLDCDSLKLGADWSDDITDNAQHSRVMVAVLSPSYFERYWCMRELDLAITASTSIDGITIIPVFYGIRGLGALLKDKTVSAKWRSAWEGFKAAGKHGVDVERWMADLHLWMSIIRQGGTSSAQRTSTTSWTWSSVWCRECLSCFACHCRTHPHWAWMTLSKK